MPSVPLPAAVASGAASHGSFLSSRLNGARSKDAAGSRRYSFGLLAAVQNPAEKLGVPPEGRTERPALFAAAILSPSSRFPLSGFASPKLGEGGFLPFSFPPQNGALSARARFFVLFLFGIQLSFRTCCDYRVIY